MSLSREFPYTNLENGADVSEEFRRLVSQWREETAGHSSPARIASSPAYLRIISFGRPVLPLILKELEANGGHWYPALRAITGENPVHESARGKTRLMNEAWLDWGRGHKYLILQSQI